MVSRSAAPRPASALGALLALALGAAAALAADDPLPSKTRWLAPGADRVRALGTEPAARRESEAGGGTPSVLARLGELAFRSPYMLGGPLARAGMSCNTCHAGGATNADFFIANNSPRPGSVDVSHAFFNVALDDGRANARDIPSLRGVRLTAPYGRDGRFASLVEFTRHVIVTEFRGAEPDPAWLDALVAYQFDLAFPANPALAAGGRLATSADPAAKRGEALFQRDCAECHRPSAAFIDRRAHDIGTGGHFDTPTLLGVNETAPYFHDGRAARLADVVDHFDDVFRLGYDARDKLDMVAFLTAVGAAPPRRPVTVAGDIDRLIDFIDLLRFPLGREDDTGTGMLALMLRHELSLIDGRFAAPDHMAARRVIAAWNGELVAIARLAETRDFVAARGRLSNLLDRMANERGALEAAEPGSYYDPAELAGAQR